MSLSPPRVPAARRNRVNGSFQASRLLFKKLWRSRVRLSDTVIIGQDGIIETWLFWSKKARCLLQKSYDTRMDGHGHERLIEKFRHGHTPQGNMVHDGVAHVIGPSGRAIFTSQGFRIGIKDAETQYQTMKETVEQGGQNVQPTRESIQEHLLSRSKERRVIGKAVITHYVEPSSNCLFVITIVRNPNRPANLYEARRMGNRQVDFSFRVVQHHAGYEDIEEAEASAWRALTLPSKSNIVRPTYSHTQPSNAVDSTTGDFEIFLDFHNSQSKKTVPKGVQTALRRASEDLLSWLSTQHGMWITHIELEYMIELAPTSKQKDVYGNQNMDPHRGRPFLKAANFMEWIPCNTSRPDEQLLPGSTGVGLPMIGSRVSLSNSVSAHTLQKQSVASASTLRKQDSRAALKARSTAQKDGFLDANMNSNSGEQEETLNSADAEETESDGESLEEIDEVKYDHTSDNLFEATALRRTTIRGRIQIADAPPRAWSDLMDLQARRPYACTIEEEDLTRELGATNDHLKSVRSSNIGLVRRLRSENETNYKLTEKLKKTRAKMIEFGKWRKDGLRQHQAEMKEEKRLRVQAMETAAVANAKLKKMTETLELTKARLDHHLEQEEIRLQEEKIAHMQNEKRKEREHKKLIALGKLEEALGIKHEFETKNSNSANTEIGSDDGSIESSKEASPQEKFANDPNVMQQISNLKDAVKDANAPFGAKLGVLNDLLSAMDSDGSGAVTKLEFQWAMEQVGAGASATFIGGTPGAKGKKSNKKGKERKSSRKNSERQQNEMEVLVNALDVDGDGEISFTELVDGLMRRRQEAKLLHGEKMKRAAKEAKKKAKYRAERMKVKGY